MAHPGQAAGFVEEAPGARVAVVRTRTSEFQGDLALEPRIEGAIDLAEGPFPDVLEDAERTPVEQESARIRLAPGHVRDSPMGFAQGLVSLLMVMAANARSRKVKGYGAF
jgi:hypothetical protein